MNKFWKRIVLIAVSVVICCAQVNAQNEDFYDAVRTIMHDGPNQFRNIKGKYLSTSYNAGVCESGIKVPGTIASRFVFSNGAYYEGALLQTRDTGVLKPVYIRYCNLLDSILTPLGYTRTMIENFNPKIEHFEKALFNPKLSDSSTIDLTKTHITLEVNEVKSTGLFTLELFINWQ